MLARWLKRNPTGAGFALLGSLADNGRPGGVEPTSRENAIQQVSYNSLELLPDRPR